MNTYIIAPRKRKAIERPKVNKVIEILQAEGMKKATLRKESSLFTGFTFSLQFEGDDLVRHFVTQAEAHKAWKYLYGRNTPAPIIAGPEVESKLTEVVE